MQFKKSILSIGIIACVGILLLSVNSNESLRINDENNEDRRAQINDFYNEGNDLTKEFIDKIRDNENDRGVEYRHVESDDSTFNNDKIVYNGGYKGITISGSYGQEGFNQIFIRKNDDRIWLDFDKGLYFRDNINDYNLEGVTSSNPLTFIEQNILSALSDGREILSDERGYKIIIENELNEGYKIYDDNANLVETYLDNSKGRITTKLIKTDTDIEAIYNYYYSFIDALEETDDISNIKG